MEARYAGRDMRTRTAIEQTSVVVVATLTEPGTPSPGPPGTQHIDGARFRVERTLSPAAGGAASVSGDVRVSYSRQVLPQAKAEAELERGSSYVLFCAVLAPGRLDAVKIVPHSDEAVRVVAAAFEGGAQHGTDPASQRFA
jgi:hypothetical protein